MGVFIIFHLGRNFFCPLGGVIIWQRAVEYLVSVSNCVIYILPLMLSYKYDDIVVSCDKQHFTCSFVCWWPRGGGGRGGGGLGGGGGTGVGGGGGGGGWGGGRRGGEWF